MLAFSDYTAVVTGASSGIGKAITLALAAQGATVCLVGRKRDTLETVAESARAKAATALSYQADLTIDQDVRNLTVSLQRDFQSLDLLIHSAGGIALGKVESASVENLDRQYRINVRGPYLLTQALLPMLRTRQGQIVFINSRAGLSANANESQYSATKYALRAIADSLRGEVNPYGLRVLSVFLGNTATPMQAEVHRMKEKIYRPELLIQPDDVASVVLNTLSLPRTAEVTDIRIRPLIKSA
jgi:NADP-dependent 3-hydroxy acid dehydrogenase YdfG